VSLDKTQIRIVMTQEEEGVNFTYRKGCSLQAIRKGDSPIVNPPLFLLTTLG